MAFKRTDFGRTVIDVASVIGKAVEVGDDEITLGELLYLLLADSIKIEMVVAVALSLPDELVGLLGKNSGLGALHIARPCPRKWSGCNRR
jgi:hypothetical protein